MNMKSFYTHHLVKSEDLNHHGTLYAGRSAEWFVEAGFIAAAALVGPEHVVCLQIHGMTFKKPVQKGSVICYESRIVHTGRTRLVAHIAIEQAEEVLLDGFITFVSINDNGQAVPHGLTIEAQTPEQAALQQRAREVTERK